jgi:hypothetical protein
VVARPVVAEVHHLAARLSALRPRALSLLLIGDRPYSVAEVADAVGASPLGTLPVDVRAASALTVGRSNAARVMRRSRLMRDARALAEALARWLPARPIHPPGPAGTAAPGPPSAGASPPTPPPGPPPVAPPPTAAPTPPPSRPAPRRPADGPGGQPPRPRRRRADPVRASADPPGPKHFRRERDEERR